MVWFYLTISKNANDDTGFIDYDFVAKYVIPKVLNIPSTTYFTIIKNIIFNINLNDEKYDDLRQGEITYDEWVETMKYNL